MNMEIQSLSNKQKGDLYEIQIRNLLNANPENYAWLWKDAPEIELRNAELFRNWNEFRLSRKNNKINNLPDFGGDLLLRINGVYYLIQCKNYADENSVRIEDLAGFFMMMYYHYHSLQGRVYYNSKLSANLDFYKKGDRLTFIQEKFIHPIPEAICCSTSSTNLLENMYDYQIEAYDRLKGKQRAILQLPCGMGKTLISMKVASEYDFIIILSPLREYCQQNLECFKNEIGFQEHHTLLIDSDGTRDLNTIRPFIHNHSKYILSITFKSVDIVNEFIGEIDNNRLIVIMDEFHNLSQNDILESVPIGEDEEMEEEEEAECTPDEQTPMNKLLFNLAIRMLFMSATPRIFDTDDYLNTDIFGNVEYSYEMGDAIRNQYICDYELFIPNIYQDPVEMVEGIRTEIQIDHMNDDIIKKIHFLMRGCLETGSRKCISYFQTQEDAITFKNSLLDMNDYYYLNLYVDTILSDDTRNQRHHKLTTFKTWDGIAILCSVKILDECINIPTCDAIFMANPTDSKIRNIQRISRANRLDHNNPHKISNIFIWADEYNDIVQTIKHLKDFDNSFTIEKIKIVNSSTVTEPCVDGKKEIDVKAKLDVSNMVIGIKKFGGWFEIMEKVEQYVAEHGCLPSSASKDEEIKTLKKWIYAQNRNYKHKLNLMKNTTIYDRWTEFRNQYPELFYEKNWETNLEKLKHYIIEHDCLPSIYSNDNKIKKLAKWTSHQNENYRNRKQIMKNEMIYNKWTEFRKQYQELFLSNEEFWESNLEKLVQYVLEHHHLPSEYSNDNKIKKLAKWMSHQNENYRNRKQIMKNEIMYNKWANFREQFKKLFLTKYEIWEINLEKLVQYVLEHHHLPSEHSKDNEIKTLGLWVSVQKRTYKNKKDIMRDNFIYDKWTEFRNQYKELFLSNEENWQINLQMVEQYIADHGCLPSSSESKNEEIKKMGQWIASQNQNYKFRRQLMKTDSIYIRWTEFRNKHIELFLSNEEIWQFNFQMVEEYVTKHGRLPSSKSKDKEIKKMGQWLTNQHHNYKNKTKSMKTETIYDQMTQFREKYSELFST